MSPPTKSLSVPGSGLQSSYPSRGPESSRPDQDEGRGEVRVEGRTVPLSYRVVRTGSRVKGDVVGVGISGKISLPRPLEGLKPTRTSHPSLGRVRREGGQTKIFHDCSNPYFSVFLKRHTYTLVRA